MFKKTVMLDVAELLEDKYGVSPDGGGGVGGAGGGGNWVCAPCQKSSSYLLDVGQT